MKSWSCAAALVLLVSEASAEEKKLDLRTAELYLTRLDGKATKLGPYAGKLTLVNLWATWCQPCREEMPALDDVRRRYHPRNVEIVGIALDKKRAEVRRFLAEHKVSYPILFASERTVPALGDLESVPTSLLLGPQGEVLEVIVGAVNVKELTAEIEESLARK
jgi:thiol-disulfide isomerase/thioredoxin